jgi:hypothetical protein
MRSEDEIYKLKSINDYALEMYHQARIRWEEMNVENASTDVLIKARDTIQKELDKRLRCTDNERNN